ncbi:hypothetical protein ACIBHX_36350 [Nonomuraea sp. NPDC050536]|uniref:hypothetical protein n=1 Tax=Nonomuraea sp. NPDC050536 TaxID=3364366 RepID=UPI0037C9663A
MLVAIPPVANHLTGLRPLWTQALPRAVLHPLARAGLLDLWLLFDLLAASGVLGALAVVALARGARLLATTMLALVAALSLATLLTGTATHALWYGTAYTAAAALAYHRRP